MSSSISALSPPRVTACQALTCLTNTSALLLWSGLAASAAYRMQGFGTPFADSLSEVQKSRRQESARERRSFFCKALAASAVVFGAVGYRCMRWSAH